MKSHIGVSEDNHGKPSQATRIYRKVLQKTNCKQLTLAIKMFQEEALEKQKTRIIHITI